MRSLTTKLILAFWLTSLLSIAIVTLLARGLTSREFNKFITDQNREDLVANLSDYYSENGTWVDVEKNYGNPHGHGMMNMRPLFFSIADQNGVIIVAGLDHHKGDVIPAAELGEGTEIVVNEQMVGILLVNDVPLEISPIQEQFFRRLDQSLLFTVIGTTVIAFLVGLFLSRGITHPVRELIHATRQMANGDLNQHVSVRSKDELGELASSFNKMSDDLAQSFNLRKQMTADIAHELRTPLSLIMGHAEAVHDGVLEPSRENFEIIREESERLEKLVNDLRTLSLADAGELSVDFQSIDLRDLLSGIHAHYLHQFNQKHIKLELNTASEALKIKLDPDRMAQVVNNILDNALRYTPEGGLVAIEMEKTGGKARVVIQDNGAGVTAEDAAHLFDRFYRAEESRNRDEGGSGLGLAIAKSIVEMHKGRIWAESEKGKGLRVLIELPLE